MDAAKIVGQVSRQEAENLEGLIVGQCLDIESRYAELAKTLMKFDDGKCWRALGFQSINAWARKTIPDMSKSRVYQLLDSARIKRDIGEEDRHVPEHAVRPLAKIKDPDERKAVWERAKATATEHDDEGEPVVTGPQVARIAATQGGTKPIPKSEIPAITAAPLFDSALATIAKLKSDLTAVRESAAGGLLELEAQRVERMRHDMYETVRFCRPFTACTYCKGDPKKQPQCNACKGLGWLNEAQAKQAPPRRQQHD